MWPFSGVPSCLWVRASHSRSVLSAAGGCQGAPVGAACHRADEAGVAVHDPHNAFTTRTKRAEQHAFCFDPRAFAVRLQREWQGELWLAKEGRGRGRERKRCRSGRLIACVCALTERPHRESRQGGSYEQRTGNRSDHALAAAVPGALELAAALSLGQPRLLAARADPWHEKLAGDLIEVEVAAAFASHEPGVALQALERLVEQSGRRVRIVVADALTQVFGGDDVAGARGGHHLTEQGDGSGAKVGGKRRERFAELVFEQALHPLGLEQRRGFGGLPQPQAHRLDLRQADLAGAEALGERGLQAPSERRVELALEVAGMALEWPADDHVQRGGGRRAEA